jgi:EmrB/QacA subfamily drug resistance transporter
MIGRLVAGRVSAGSVPALITLAVGVAVLIYALDLTVVATAAPTIVGEFHALGLYGWLFSAYAIPATATTLLYGRLADVYGRKRLFAIVMAGFLAGSVACGLAGSMLQLVVFRALQGLCAGATFPLAVGIIADVYPIEQRARGFSIVPFTFALASVLGPTAGGFITDSLGWRWIFFLNVPVVVLAIGILAVVYYEDRPAGQATLRHVDVPGALLLAAGLAVFLAGISTGVNGVSALSWQTVAALIGGLALLAAFVVRERRATAPLLPLRILRHRGLGGALLTIGLLIWITNSLLFFIPSLAQGVLGGTARSAGLILIPLMLTWSLVALVSLRAGQRFGFRTVALIGCAALAGALVVLAMVGPHDTQQALILPMLLAGLGAGMINPNMMLLAQHSLSDRDQGLAGGLANCTMSLTAALVAPILGALEVSRLAAHFGRSLSEPSLLLSAAGRHQLGVQFGGAYVHGLQVALGAALHDVFAAGFIALALIVVWLLVVVPSNAVVRRIRLAPLGR